MIPKKRRCPSSRSSSERSIFASNRPRFRALVTASTNQPTHSLGEVRSLSQSLDPKPDPTLVQASCDLVTQALVGSARRWYLAQASAQEALMLELMYDNKFFVEDLPSDVEPAVAALLALTERARTLAESRKAIPAAEPGDAFDVHVPEFGTMSLFESLY